MRLPGKSGNRRRRWLNHWFEHKIAEREVKGGHELVEKSAIAAQHTTRGGNYHPAPKLFSSLQGCSLSIPAGIAVKRRAVVFDLDGTLLDTLEDIADSTNIVLKRSGFPEHKVEAYRYFIGDGVEDLASRTLPSDQQGPAMIAGVVSAIREEYRKRWADKTRPYDGIPEVLDALTIRGVKLTVLSNKPDDLTQLSVSKLLPRWRFELVIGAGPSVPKKPDPTAALEMAKWLNIPPGEFLLVGDADTDMKTAISAGMYPVGALWGFRTAEELLASGAEKLIESPMDLLELL